MPHKREKEGLLMSGFLVKIAILSAVCAVGANTAVYFTDRYVTEVASKQKSIAETLAANRLREAMRDAEEAARAELSERGVDIEEITRPLETKPPVTEPPLETTPPAETTPPETETEPEASETEPPARVTEFKRGGLLDSYKVTRDTPVVRSVITLTKEENERMFAFLEEHYFLNGYDYAALETDPSAKARKSAAAEMQGYVTDSLNLVLGFLDISDPLSLLNAAYAALADEAARLGDEFTEKYADASSLGPEFSDIYDGGVKYFARLRDAFGAVKTAADNYSNAANPLLAAMILAGSVDTVLIPELLGTLDSSFDITEACQEVFLEGTAGAWLLTREEVSEILANPGIIL
jgi:hypothetical protein